MVVVKLSAHKDVDMAWCKWHDDNGFPCDDWYPEEVLILSDVDADKDGGDDKGDKTVESDSPKPSSSDNPRSEFDPSQREGTKT